MSSTIHSHLQPGTGIPNIASKTPGVGTSVTGAETVSKLGFRDVLDIINPLQHIPIVGHLYRGITGDSIHPMIKIAGGALFGGPIGAAVSAATLAFTNGKQEPALPPGGIDPATVANTYPFADTYTGSMAATTTSVSLNSPLRHYTNGIPNPAVMARLKQAEELAVITPTPAPAVNADKLANTYQPLSPNNSSAAQPLVDIHAGVKEDAG